MTTDNSALRQFIMLFFNDDELEDFCLDYFTDVAQDFTVGMTKSQKVRLLIGHADRRDRREHLLAALAKERPESYTVQIGRAPTPVVAAPAVVTRDPRRVFISHAHQDAATAHQLAADLTAAGRPVWIAPESVLPGEQWVEAIGRGLETSGVFVLLLSPEAVASHWVRYEMNLAIMLEKRGRLEILPLDWQPCEPPITWQGYQYLPFRNYNNGLAALLARLDEHLEPTPPPREERVAATAPLYPRISSRPSHRSRIQPRPLTPLIQVPRIHEKSGIELIYIPAGMFLYGNENQFQIDMPEYWIGRYPVTNAQYKSFLDANPNYRVPFVSADWATPINWYAPHRAYPAGKGDHPVVMVSWDDAKAFCDWAGLALPTEEQWEKGARGANGRIWPWGNTSPTKDHCNFNRNVGGTTEVGQYSPRGDSPYGCVDMAGNVWEWTESWYEEGLTRALRGGSWINSSRGVRAVSRNNFKPDFKNFYVGFRVAGLLSGPEPA